MSHFLFFGRLANSGTLPTPYSTSLSEDFVQVISSAILVLVQYLHSNRVVAPRPAPYEAEQRARTTSDQCTQAGLAGFVHFPWSSVLIGTDRNSYGTWFVWWIFDLLVFFGS